MAEHFGYGPEPEESVRQPAQEDEVSMTSADGDTVSNLIVFAADVAGELLSAAADAAGDIDIDV